MTTGPRATDWETMNIRETFHLQSLRPLREMRQNVYLAINIGEVESFEATLFRSPQNSIM
jgi:hypothetical protein